MAYSLIVATLSTFIQVMYCTAGGCHQEIGVAFPLVAGTPTDSFPGFMTKFCTNAAHAVRTRRSIEVQHSSAGWMHTRTFFGRHVLIQRYDDT